MVSIASHACSGPNRGSPRSVGWRVPLRPSLHGEACAEHDQGPTVDTRVLKNVNGPVRTYKREAGEADDFRTLPDLSCIAPSPSPPPLCWSTRRCQHAEPCSTLAASRVTVRRPQFAVICGTLTLPLAAQRLYQPAHRLTIEVIDGRGSFVTSQYV